MHAQPSVPEREPAVVDAAALLWRSREVLRAPFERSWRGLMTVRATFADAATRSVAGHAFAAAADRLIAAAPAAREQVWSDPRAYWWTRVAEDLLVASREGTPPRIARATPPAVASAPAARRIAALGADDVDDAVARHLAAFEAFTLGLAVVAGERRRLTTPLRVALPWSLPGTPWSLTGSGIASVSGVDGERVRFADGAAVPLVDGATVAHDGATITVRRNVAVAHGACDVLLTPDVFHVPGFAVGVPALEAGRDYHARHAELVRRTLAVVERHAPEAFAFFADVIRVIGLKPRERGGYDDWSEPELPGSFIASVIDNPLELADHFIHELQHNRLSCIEELGPLFDGDTDANAARWFSPWRDQLRGLYGIFHGVYVFVALGRYWLRVCEANDHSAAARPYVIDRVIRTPLQLALALEVLERHARLAPLGRAVLAQLARDTDDLRASVARAAIPRDAAAIVVTPKGGYAAETDATGRPLSVRESVRAHLRRNDVHGQCATVAAALLGADA